MPKNISENISASSEYDLELEKLAKKIRKDRCKTVLLQLPDGLKPKAAEIADFIEDSTKAKCLIWLGDCYGACDIPQNLQAMKVDMIVQWGHNKFVKSKGW